MAAGSASSCATSQGRIPGLTRLPGMSSSKRSSRSPPERGSKSSQSWTARVPTSTGWLSCFVRECDVNLIERWVSKAARLLFPGTHAALAAVHRVVTNDAIRAAGDGDGVKGFVNVLERAAVASDRLNSLSDRVDEVSVVVDDIRRDSRRIAELADVVVE